MDINKLITYTEIVDLLPINIRSSKQKLPFIWNRTHDWTIVHFGTPTIVDWVCKMNICNIDENVVEYRLFSLQSAQSRLLLAANQAQV